jgi:dTDP-4-dehydrorhamnose 3,5-epimerase
VAPTVFRDGRGFFLESYKASEFEAAGISERFVQDNVSRSEKGALRGLHFQAGTGAQAKLVRACRGRLWDVAVDLRPGSPAYGRWHGVELSEANGLMLYIPAGFAHGTLALEAGTELHYKCSAEYDPALESGVRWDDPHLAIDWPEAEPRLSPKDAALPFLRDLR